jgi:hypothetical protein
LTEISNTLSDTNNSLYTHIQTQGQGQTTKKNLSEIISIEKQTLNFGMCFPGEIIKRRFKIKNNSYTDKFQIEIKFNFAKDVNFKKYFLSITCDENNTNNASFPNIENSMLKYNCFNILGKEDEPVSERKILLKEFEETEIEISFTSPFNKSRENFYSVIHVISKNQVIHSILIISTLEIPKLLCLKELNSPNAKFPLIPLMLEIKSKGQKFRLPFKNASLKDMLIEISIETCVSKNSSVFGFDDNYYECQFFIFPSLLEIPAQSMGSIDLIAKIRRIKNDENLDKLKLSGKLNSNKVRKIILGKIKGASVVYNFFVEAQIRGAQN